MTLYLGIPDASGINWASFPYFTIVNYLQSWLSSSCGASDPVRVLTVGKPGPGGGSGSKALLSRMSPMDGLVYLVGDFGDSVIHRVGAPESGDLHVGETSSLRGEMISEVYVNFMHAYGIAATVYHELLHNKFRLSVNVHGTADGNFTSATAPYSEGGPSAADQNLMCAAFQERAKQFQGGF